MQGFQFKPANEYSKFLRFEEDDWDEVENFLNEVLRRLSEGAGQFLDLSVMVAIALSYERDTRAAMTAILEIAQEKLKSGDLLGKNGLLDGKMSIVGTSDVTWQVHGMATLMYLGWRLCCI